MRLALASAVLAGSALVGFAGAAWWLIYNAKVSRLDEALKSQLMRAGRPRWAERLQQQEALLPRALGTDADAPTALLIMRFDGATLYRSQDWPPTLNLNSVWDSQPRPALDRSLDNQPAPSRRQRFAERRPDALLSNFRFTTQKTLTGNWRLGSASFSHQRVAIAVSLVAIDHEMSSIRTLFLIAIGVALLLVGAGAWWLSGTALAPIQRLTSAIRQVTVKGLDQRVPSQATDVEFVELIHVFNHMLETLERSFKQASRFSGDAAHELKTPLAILQGELERTLHQAEPGSTVQQTLSSLLDEVRRLSGIVRKLLLLSLADAGQMSLHRVAVNLSEILKEMEEDVELLAPHLRVETEIASGLIVQGDHDLLIQVLQNLLSNAIKYNLAGGWIKIHAYSQKTTACVTITNASKTILPQDQERIFERFHRGDPARTRKVEGTGLGLNLSREIARAHHGNLALNATPPGQTAFTLTLPL